MREEEARVDRGRNPCPCGDVPHWEVDREAMVKVLFKSTDGRLLSLGGIPSMGEDTPSASPAADGNDPTSDEANLSPSTWALRGGVLGAHRRSGALPVSSTLLWGGERVKELQPWSAGLEKALGPTLPPWPFSTIGDTKLSSNPTAAFRLLAATEMCGVGGGKALHSAFEATVAAGVSVVAAAAAPVTVGCDLESGGDFIMVALLRELDLRTRLGAWCCCESDLNADPDDGLGRSAVPRRAECPG